MPEMFAETRQAPTARSATAYRARRPAMLVGIVLAGVAGRLLVERRNQLLAFAEPGKY